MTEKVRIFFALEIPLPIKRLLIRSFADLGLTTPLKPAAPEFMHLTLKFWPAFPLRELPELIKALTLVADQSKPVPLLFNKAEIFGGKTARALVLTSVISEELGELRELLEQTLVHQRLADPEPRLFRPHVTIARPTQNLNPTDKTKFLKWRVNLETESARLTLYESRRTPHGREYDPLLELPL
jgi:2'-5' RNA ligase